ncbi:hypothetical protein GCM10027062_29730 [Nocardioides hungaricus]
MRGHERGDLPRDLQVRHVPVEMDPVQALHIERGMTIKKITDPKDVAHHHSVRPPARPGQPQTRRSEAEPHWKAAE